MKSLAYLAALLLLVASGDSFAWKKQLIKFLSPTAKTAIKQRAFSHEPLEAIAVTSLIPRSADEYLRTFGATSAADATRKLRSIQRDMHPLSEIDEMGFRFEQTTTVKEFRNGLHGGAKSEMRLVLAHAEAQGRKIVFPSGERLSFAQMRELCDPKMCVIVSCHSRDLGLNSEISLRAAIGAIEHTVRTWKTSRSRNLFSRTQIRLANTPTKEPSLWDAFMGRVETQSIVQPSASPMTAKEFAEELQRVVRAQLKASHPQMSDEQIVAVTVLTGAGLITIGKGSSQ